VYRSIEKSIIRARGERFESLLSYPSNKESKSSSVLTVKPEQFPDIRTGQSGNAFQKANDPAFEWDPVFQVGLNPVGEITSRGLGRSCDEKVDVRLFEAAQEGHTVS
jgi:hypothetical protein